MHGTLSSYTNHGCRCVQCKAALAQYSRSRREAGKEDAEGKKKWQRAYYLKNKHRWDEQRRSKSEWHKEYIRAWRKLNPEIVNRLSRSYKHRKRAVKYDTFSEAKLQSKLSMYAGCWVCGGEKEQIDHVKPLSKGGWHILANLRPIYGDCNRRKGAMWPLNNTKLNEMKVRVK